jgi:hypothetical protein
VKMAVNCRIQARLCLSASEVALCDSLDESFRESSSLLLVELPL